MGNMYDIDTRTDIVDKLRLIDDEELTNEIESRTIKQSSDNAFD
jgi:hypothetical protein